MERFEEGKGGIITVGMRHPLHGRGCHHDGHGDVEAQDIGAQVDFGDVDENARTESAQHSVSRQIAPKTLQLCGKPGGVQETHCVCAVVPDALKGAAILLQGPLILRAGSVVVVHHLRQLLPRELFILGHVHDLVRHGGRRRKKEQPNWSDLSSQLASELTQRRMTHS